MLTKEKAIFSIEPDTFINDFSELSKEIMLWADKENKTVQFLNYTLQPLLTIDGVKYQAKLELPKMIQTRFENFFATNRLGARFIYFYKV